MRQGASDGAVVQISLVGGQKISALMAVPAAESPGPTEEPGATSTVTLDAAGYHHTVYVLEGIGADGKGWTRQERQRADSRINKVAAAADGG